MNCQRARELIDPLIDDEVGVAEAGEIRRHFADCEECNLAYRNLLHLSSTLKDNSLYHRAPETLKKRVSLSLREEVEVAGVEPTGLV